MRNSTNTGERDRQTETNIERATERVRERERDRNRDRETDIQRQRERQTERQRERDGDPQRDIERDRDRQNEREREREALTVFVLFPILAKSKPKSDESEPEIGTAAPIGRSPRPPMSATASCPLPPSPDTYSSTPSAPIQF